MQVWSRSHTLALDVYQVTRLFPREEQYGLVGQMRRAVVSIPSNIAEGCGKDSAAEFARYLEVARGSASEIEYQLLLAHELDLLPSDDHVRLAGQVIAIRKMLTALINRNRAPSRAFRVAEH